MPKSPKQTPVSDLFALLARPTFGPVMETARLKPKRKKQTWWARGEGIARMGPFESQAEAAAALLTTDGTHLDNAFVWSEGGNAK